MKTTILKLGSFILLFALMGAGCEKEDKPELPPITQSGAGTFGCLLNGKVFVAKNWLFGATTGASNNQWEDKRWIIEGVGDDYVISIEICKDSVINGESILIRTTLESCSNGIIVPKSNSTSEISSHSTTNSSVGKVVITRYDTTNRIISGTFYFDAVNSSGEKTEVRDGRFDVKFTG